MKTAARRKREAGAAEALEQSRRRVGRLISLGCTKPVFPDPFKRHTDPALAADIRYHGTQHDC
jgi:hypothetical protein